MKKSGIILGLLLALTSAAFGQAAYVRSVEDITVRTSGAIAQHNNTIGELNASFNYDIIGGQTITSITIQGCMRSTVTPASPQCSLLDTYTPSSTSTLRQTTGLYDFFLITPTWTGGTNASVVVHFLGTSNSSPSITVAQQLFSNGAVTTAVNVKQASGNLYGWLIQNTNASVCYVQVFDSLAANVTLGTTVPKLFIPLGPNTGGPTQSSPTQLSTLGFATALSVAATTTPTGNTTCATGVAANIWFQ